MSVPDEPSNTCPLIDDVLKNVKAAEKAFDILNDLDFSGIDDTLEEIRSANSDLRERMTHFEELADQHVEEMEKKDREIKELEAQIETLKDELKAALNVETNEPVHHPAAQVAAA